MEQGKDFYLYTSNYLAANPGTQKKSITTLKEGAVPRTKAELAAVAEIKQGETKKEDSTAKTEMNTALTEIKEEAKKEEQVVKEEAAKEKQKEKESEAVATEQKQKEKESEAVAAKEKQKEKESEAVAIAEKKKHTKESKAESAKGSSGQKTEVMAEEEPVAATGPCNHKLPNFSNLKGKSLNDEKVYDDLLAAAGNYCAEGLVFKVQVGAYKNPTNFTYSNIKSLGRVESETYPDGITRFTQKEFNTLKAAEKHRRKAIAKGQKDAWIVAFANGKRYTLEDLIMLDFLGKPIN
jgi:hypothetical protein